MSAERIDGIKYHLHQEPDQVVENVYSHLLDKHQRLMGDIERITGELAVRGLIPGPEDYQEALFDVSELDRG